MDNYLTRREKIGTTGTERPCLWLGDAQPSLVRSSSLLRAHLETSRNFRLGSNRPPTRELAATARQFGEIRQPDTRYLLAPHAAKTPRPRKIPGPHSRDYPPPADHDAGHLYFGAKDVWRPARS